MSPDIFFISHYHSRPSELWLSRIREALQSRICAEAYFDVGESPSPNTLCISQPWWSWLCKKGIVHDLKFAPPRRRVLLKAVNESNAGVVYCHYANLATRLESCWRGLDIPVVVHCHGFDVTFDLRDASGRRRYSDKYRERVLELGRTSYVIANSDFTRQNLVEHGMPSGRIQTWHFGVPQAGSKVQVPDSKAQILYLGRFVGFKGPTETIRAFAMARSQGLKANLVMAGDGPLLNECRRLATSLGLHNDVTFPGVVDADQASRLFGESHVFTAHTQRDPVTRQCEAFGVAFAEALGAGLPVITGRHAGPATYLTHNHDSLLFEPGDIAAHAQSLLNVASDHDLRTRLSRNARSTAAEKFDLERQHTELLNLLSRFAGRSE